MKNDHHNWMLFKKHLIMAKKVGWNKTSILTRLSSLHDRRANCPFLCNDCPITYDICRNECRCFTDLILSKNIDTKWSEQGWWLAKVRETKLNELHALVEEVWAN